MTLVTAGRAIDKPDILLADKYVVEEYTAGGKLSLRTYYRNAEMTNKLQESAFTYSGSKLLTEELTQYEEDGVTVYKTKSFTFTQESLSGGRKRLKREMT
jgi:hypothetical protein